MPHRSQPRLGSRLDRARVPFTRQELNRLNRHHRELAEGVFARSSDLSSLQKRIEEAEHNIDFSRFVEDNTETFITVTYDDDNEKLNFIVPVLDEDNMASDSDVHLATQQSIKAYVDASGVADGDKGDITVSSSGTVWTIDPDVVTYAKMQNPSQTDVLIGSDDGTILEEILLSANFTLTPATEFPLLSDGSSKPLLSDGSSFPLLASTGVSTLELVDVVTSDGTTGGTGSAGAGNQFVQMTIGGITYKVLHDGTV